ncbi:hypothetical protein M0R45_024606 [Rubus argutus]|uniref:J domain-containing protein n=1 Tax=Rubus argutus TaxID=59490 RepID=A0AAW1WVK3_RUBAR
MVKSTERVCYYETLRLEPNCSREDIKMAYYVLSKIYHPDKYNSKCDMSKTKPPPNFWRSKKPTTSS